MGMRFGGRTTAFGEWWRRFAPPPELRDAINAWDTTVSRGIAERSSSVQDVLMPALSRFADHAVLWATVSAGLGATGRRPAQRAARRGMISLGLTSLLVNAIAKRVLPRDRPPLESVPLIRRAIRRPSSGSFPSGHAASAAAFATAASHAWPVLTVPLAALAAAVGYSRVFTGVHYPSDVLFGAAIGTAVGAVVNRIAPLRTPEPLRIVEPLAAPQPPRPDGAGVIMVVNPSSGGGRGARVAEQLRSQLPQMELAMLPEGGDLDDVLRRAASRAQVLGIVGGDGSVSAAARVAIEAGLPLAVAPGGTFNHFAADLGASQPGDAVRAIREGTAIRADVGVIRDLTADPAAVEGARPGSGAGGNLLHVFVNTASLASYPSFVAARERWESRLGKNLAAVVAIWTVLHTEQPLRATLNGRHARVAMLFIGNGRYQPYGFVPAWRPRLDDGILDLRIVEAGRWLPITRLAVSLVTGRLGRSRLYTEVASAGLDVTLPDGPTRLAWDGEVGPGPAHLRFEIDRLALTVMRPSVRADHRRRADAPSSAGRAWRRKVSEKSREEAPGQDLITASVLGRCAPSDRSGDAAALETTETRRSDMG